MKKRRILSAILCFVMMLSLLPVVTPNASASETGNATFDNFIADARWRDGASYSSGQRPKLSTFSGWGCCAYAADFTKYCYGINNPRGGIATFYNVNEIRAGDVLTVGYQSDGTGHWFVALKRDGDRLYVAEGNVDGGRVRVGWNYSINASQNKFNEDSRSFTCGYHFLNPQPSHTHNFSNYICSCGQWEALAETGIAGDRQSYQTTGAVSVYNAPYSNAGVAHSLSKNTPLTSGDAHRDTN